MDDFNALQQAIQSALVATTRSVSSIAAEDLSFHRSLDPSLGTKLDEQNSRLLAITQGLLGSATATSESVQPPLRLRDIDAVEGNWRAIVDVVDSLLERADTVLDEFTGAVKRLTPTREVTPNPKAAPKGTRSASAFRSQELTKPQLLFDHPPNNFETQPFKPLLVSKPHAKRPLETEPTRRNGESSSQYAHPYQVEIEGYEFPASVYATSEPIMYHPFETTTATLVDTEKEMEEMLVELKQAREIAIDLEHHDHRSYIGLVSLMQISTRDRDWIVDTLKPWRRKLQCLNEVFADPTILKVLHGAFMDVVWLQRDLGLYLVGLFDTHYACRALGYPGGSLAFLLKKFIDFDAQKQYQTADWRIRPLPQELFDYARSDTHYLLYIYDCMRNELIAKSDFSKPNHESDKLWDVLQKSKDTALQRYEHPTYDYELGQGSAGWYKMLARTPATFTKEQFAVFRAVHQWRDQVARHQDDSVHSVMVGHNIFSIARALPSTKEELLSIAQPLTQTSRLRSDELFDVVSKARIQSSDAPEMMEVLSRIEPKHWRKHVEKPPSSTFGLAQHLPKPPKEPILDEPNNSGPLRSTSSSFWGKSFPISSRKRTDFSTSVNVSIAIPLPPLATEAFADSDESSALTPTKTLQKGKNISQPTGNQPDQKGNREDDILMLKQMGKKRRRADHADGLALQDDTLAVDPEEAAHRAEKAERKRARKEAKRAARASETNSATIRDEIREIPQEQLFDYENAPDMLQLPRESRADAKKKSKKQFNPYSKALDTTKGLPRVQRERAGKTMTFKE